MQSNTDLSRQRQQVKQRRVLDLLHCYVTALLDATLLVV